MRYDYLIVGAGLFGSVFAQKAKEVGKKVLVIDKRNHIAGNAFTEEICGINVHKYGAHIFHTSNKEVWDYVNKFAEFNNFINSPIANYRGELYSLPFNMHTFSKMWNIEKPIQAMRIIDNQKLEVMNEPNNLEEQAISLVGRDIYEKLIKGYTEKQWGKECKDLPSSIIKRIPVRFTYNNNYFNDKYQGIPIGGYTKMVEKMLEDIDVELDVDYLKNRDKFSCDKVIYTGAIDEYFHYCLGELEYRSLRFKEQVLSMNNFQGNAVVNYTSYEIPWTRIIEHKFFEGKDSNNTVITKEYPSKWKKGMEPYYPINDEKNNRLYELYKKLSEKEENIIFAGRLGEYKYYDMDKVIESAFNLFERLEGKC